MICFHQSLVYAICSILYAIPLFDGVLGTSSSPRPRVPRSSCVCEEHRYHTRTSAAWQGTWRGPSRWRRTRSFSHVVWNGAVSHPFGVRWQCGVRWGGWGGWLSKLACFCSDVGPGAPKRACKRPENQHQKQRGGLESGWKIRPGVRLYTSLYLQTPLWTF